MKLLQFLCLILSLFVLSCQTETNSNKQETFDQYITILGIAQDAGYPQIDCNKDCCKKYHKGKENKKLISCLGLVDKAANKKYLSGNGQRALKISAGVLGGYLLATIIHLLAGVLFQNKGAIVVTAAYSTFFFWISFMILAFLSKNGWKIWGIYLLASAICGLLVFILR